MRELRNLFAWAICLSEAVFTRLTRCCWVAKEAWLVGLPQGKLHWGGVSAARCRNLHLQSSRLQSFCSTCRCLLSK